MDGVYYLCMLIGVAWLCVWAMAEDGETRPGMWWPFDRRDEPRPPEQARQPWRRRG